MTLDDQLVRFILAIVVVIAGMLFVAYLFQFGRRLFERTPERHFFAEIYHFVRRFAPSHNLPRVWLDGVFASYDQYLDKRNEFWEHFGQVSLAALIVVVLAVLLLTKVISAEAGLPILSAVAGFAIAKSGSVQVNRRNSQGPDGPDNG